jgi:phosphonate transport system ATP-binding protein
MKISLQHTSARHPAAPATAPAAMRGVTLEIAAGEHVAVIGPSGAGKTTLLHALACALRPSAGTLHLGGRDPWALPHADLQRLRGQLFLAPQVPPLPPRQRVITAVLAGRLPGQSLAASLRSLFYPTNIPLADAALARFDLSDKLFERVDRLSGGERQRVGMARALVAMAAPARGSAGRGVTSEATSAGATLLLVDEPLSALDPTRAVQAITNLTGAAKEKGATLVATLHHVEMALQHFPRIIGLRGGELAFDLPAAQVSQQHLHALYAQHLHELTGPAPELVDEPATAALPAVMHCR